MPFNTLELYLSVLTVCAGIGLFQRKYLTGTFRWIGCLVGLTWLVEVSGYVLLRNRISNFWLFQLFTPIEYGLLAAYFHASQRSRPLRRAIVISVGVLGVFVMAYAIVAGLHLPNSYSFQIEAGFVLLWVLLYFFELYNRDETLQLWQLPEFWANTGLLFFFAGTFFQMGLFTYLIRVGNKSLANQLYVINHILNILLYSLYAVGFVCKTAQKKSELS